MLGLNGPQGVQNHLGAAALQSAVALPLQVADHGVELLTAHGRDDGKQVAHAWLVFRIVANFAVAVGNGPLDFAADGVLRVQNGDVAVVRVGLAHLAGGLLQAHDPAADFAEVSLGHGENVAVNAVETLGNVPGQLQMLLLVGSDGHQISLIKQNVRRHQDGIVEQTRVDVVRVLGAFVLVLGHAGKLAHVGKAVQNPRQLRMAADMALTVDDVLLRVQTAGNVGGGHFQTAAAQLGRILPNGDGVHIHHAVDAVVVVLQKGEIPQRADVVADGQGAGGLNAGEDRFFDFRGLGFHGDSSSNRSVKTSENPPAGSGPRLIR